jgi:starch-binding outer membrane protein, SusD/RagB family
LKALVYLQWASPAFNPDNDLSRWENAAKYAAEVMDFKLTQDGAHGFDPAAAFAWTDPNSPEIIWSSDYSKGSTLEKLFYPAGFLGTGSLGPTQELVDAFPAANGYPIDHPLSNYDPLRPYADRDSRFYSTIFHNGADVCRVGNGEVMYTFDTSVGGRDEAGGINNSMTNYYIRKYLYLGWNGNDESIQTMPKSIFFIRWAQMCLTFAEAANRVSGPTTELYGYTPKQALAYLRSRPTNDGMPGVGATADPYLDECAAAGPEEFEKLVRNERRIELCFEGQRFYDLRRWATDATALNGSVSKPVISAAQINRVEVEKRSYQSLWVPIPYTEMIRMEKMVQNEGWSNWE